MCRRVFPWARLLLLPFIAAGCGRDEKGPTPVHGIVKVDGQPLVGATVLFFAQNSQGERQPVACTDADGEFRLTTFRMGDGAPPGKYKVVIRPAGGGAIADPHFHRGEATGPAPKAVPSSVNLPDRYTDYDKTILEQVVPPQGDVVFELESN